MGPGGGLLSHRLVAVRGPGVAENQARPVAACGRRTLAGTSASRVEAWRAGNCDERAALRPEFRAVESVSARQPARGGSRDAAADSVSRGRTALSGTGRSGGAGADDR